MNDLLLRSKKREVIGDGELLISNFSFNVYKRYHRSYIEKQQLRSDGKVTDYLPAYPKKYGDQIAIKHLLSHTSGLIDIPEVPGLEWNRERLGHTQEEVLAYFKDRELKVAPGTNFHYSNFGYYLLSVILEKITSQSYSDLLQQEIFVPAKMTSSSVAHNREVLFYRGQWIF
jgi:CubicO group peptidase (beta-lactamase class C family)